MAWSGQNTIGETENTYSKIIRIVKNCISVSCYSFQLIKLSYGYNLLRAVWTRGGLHCTEALQTQQTAIENFRVRGYPNQLTSHCCCAPVTCTSPRYITYWTLISLVCVCEAVIVQRKPQQLKTYLDMSFNLRLYLFTFYFS